MTIHTPYYFGHAENKLNSKGQVALPARFRSVLPPEEASTNFAIIMGEKPCLYMYTYKQFERIKDNALRVAEESNDDDFFRRFLAETHSVDIDTQGRFVLPQAFMKKAGIKGPSVLFIGVNDRLEIWEPEAFAANQGDLERYNALRAKAARKIFGM